VGLGALRERGSGGSRAGLVGSGAWGEADRERVGAWSFGKRQGAPGTGRERGSRGPERGGSAVPERSRSERGLGVRTREGTLRQPCESCINLYYFNSIEKYLSMLTKLNLNLFS
jgi:hypothetical protein